MVKIFYSGVALSDKIRACVLRAWSLVVLPSRSWDVCCRVLELGWCLVRSIPSGNVPPIL